jgi:hypothetical protein
MTVGQTVNYSGSWDSFIRFMLNSAIYSMYIVKTNRYARKTILKEFCLHYACSVFRLVVWLSCARATLEASGVNTTNDISFLPSNSVSSSLLRSIGTYLNISYICINMWSCFASVVSSLLRWICGYSYSDVNEYGQNVLRLDFVLMSAIRFVKNKETELRKRRETKKLFGNEGIFGENKMLDSSHKLLRYTWTCLYFLRNRSSYISFSFSACFLF